MVSKHLLAVVWHCLGMFPHLCAGMGACFEAPKRHRAGVPPSSCDGAESLLISWWFGRGVWSEMGFICTAGAGSAVAVLPLN